MSKTESQVDTGAVKIGSLDSALSPAASTMVEAEVRQSLDVLRWVGGLGKA